MSLLLLNCLHVTLFFLLIHGEFFWLLLWAVFILGVSFHFPLKAERTNSQDDMTLSVQYRGSAGFLWEKFLFYVILSETFWPDFLCSKWLLSDGTKSLWFKLCWWEYSLFLLMLISNMMINVLIMRFVSMQKLSYLYYKICLSETLL